MVSGESLERSLFAVEPRDELRLSVDSMADLPMIILPSEPTLRHSLYIVTPCKAIFSVLAYNPHPSPLRDSALIFLPFQLFLFFSLPHSFSTVLPGLYSTLPYSMTVSRRHRW